MFSLSNAGSNGMAKSEIYQIATSVFLKYNNKKIPRKEDLKTIYARAEASLEMGGKFSKAMITSVAEEYFRSISR